MIIFDSFISIIDEFSETLQWVGLMLLTIILSFFIQRTNIWTINLFLFGMNMTPVFESSYLTLLLAKLLKDQRKVQQQRDLNEPFSYWNHHIL